MKGPRQAARALRVFSEGAVRGALARSRARLGNLSDYFAATSAAQEFRRQGRDYLELAGSGAALRRAYLPGAGLPRALFIISTEVGGTPQTNQDLMSALSDRYETYVLRSDARSVILSRWSADGYTVLRRVRLPEPLQPFPHVDRNYDRLLAGWLAEYAFSVVHIRHLAWHSLSLPRLARSFGARVVFSFHDFYTICPTTRLVDENDVFCGGTCTATPGQCSQQMWTGNVPPLKNNAVFGWRDRMAAMLAECDAFVTTSASTRERIIRFFPQTAAKAFPVIEHGRDFHSFGQVGRFPDAGERVRVLVPGNISGSKGARILASMQALDRADRFQFHVLGKAARELAHLPNVICHGAYDRSRFSEIVAGIQPHFGIVLSIWAETFCHTLTEMWACGLPVAAFDLGAVGDRIRQHGGGWLIANVSPEAAMAKLVSIVSDRSGFSARLGQVSAWRDGPGAEQTCAWMADRYDALYRQLLDQARPAEDVGALQAGEQLPAFGAQALG